MLSTWPSDARLARLVRRGDARAFELLYDRYHDPLCRYCRALTGHPQDAEEAVQTTMLRAYRALSAREVATLRPWLYRVAHNACLDLIRARPDWEALSPLTPDLAPDAHQRHEARERVEELRRDLGALPARPRSALLLRELGGLSHREIAGALGTSPEAVKRLIHSAREGLAASSAGRELACRAVRRTLSDGDARVLRSRRLNVHLADCPECRSFRAALAERAGQLAAV
jgi:RNA polymerase sigma factor (sigma-70 family)